MADYVLWAFEEILSLSPASCKDIGSKVAIPSFDERTISELIDQYIPILEHQPVVVDLKGPVVIVGDLHGNFIDLIRILSSQGLPPQVNYLFLGDYLDRGGYSLETITLLLSLAVNYPDHVTLLRGNHEIEAVNSEYGFLEDMRSLYNTDHLFHAFNKLFSFLPLVAILDQKYFCVHGGISEHLTEWSQIRSLEKPILNDSDPMIRDMLWADPSPTFPDYSPSPRGKGKTFGSRACDAFLEKFNITTIIRGHQCILNGVEKSFHGKVVTVFSSSCYDQEFENSAGVLLCDESGQLDKNTFSSWGQLKRSSARFVSSGFKSLPLLMPNKSRTFLSVGKHTVQPLRLHGQLPVSRSLAQGRRWSSVLNFRPKL